MHIFFSGIGGTGIGPLALVAKQAGFTVSGSDQKDSQYIQHLRDKGITDIHIGQTEEAIAAVHAKNPIDWYVHSSSVGYKGAQHPELDFVKAEGIRSTKRGELINHILQEKGLKMIAIAGTHGKTTTTAMTVWLLQQLEVPVSYILPAKTSFADMGHYEEGSQYFVYEADEYDRNFLDYHPFMSLITGIDWDHPDIFPTRDDYYAAFRDFLGQSEHTVIWHDDADKIGVSTSDQVTVLDKNSVPSSTLAGAVNRQNAALTAQSIMQVLGLDDFQKLVDTLNDFPGVSRRFEQIAPNVYTDYAHTPEKIRGALQLAHEKAGDQNVVVVYEGLHNTRQHFIKDELAHLFDDVDQLYIVPSYRAREDESLEDLIPEKLIALLSQPDKARPAKLDDQLKRTILEHAKNNDLVLCLSAGGGGSLDEWLRAELS